MWGFVLFKWWSFRGVAQHCRKFVVLRVAVLRCRSETHSDVVLYSSLMLPWQPYTAVTCNAPRNLLKSCRPAASFWMQQVGNFDSSDFKAVIKKNMQKLLLATMGGCGAFLIWSIPDFLVVVFYLSFLHFDSTGPASDSTCRSSFIHQKFFIPEKALNETSVPKLVNNKHVGGGKRG